MSGEKSATPPTQRSSNLHPEEEEKEEGLGGEERLSATPKSVSEPPEGWEPLPPGHQLQEPRLPNVPLPRRHSALASPGG